MGPPRRVDFLTLTSAIVALFLGPSSGPWWTVKGATTSGLLSVQISPYYLQTDATGISSSLPFSAPLGSITNLLLILSLIVLGASSFQPTAWWNKLAVYFGLCTMTELYLSFLLMYHGALTMLLGAYGIVIPFFGTNRLPTNILGLDLNTHPNPLVTASIGLPFYLGFLSLGLIATGEFFKSRRERKESTARKGIAAIFSPETG